MFNPHTPTILVGLSPRFPFRRRSMRCVVPLQDAALVHRAVQPDQVARSAAMAGVSRGAEWSGSAIIP